MFVSDLAKRINFLERTRELLADINNMMKHESVVKSLPIPSAKDGGKKSLWKTGGKTAACESTTPKSPITKAFDFLPWSRNKRAVSEKPLRQKNESSTATTGSSIITANVASGSSANATEDKKYALASLNYQNNIFRNGGGLIRDIINEKINKNERIFKKSNVRKARQVKGRNKSLDINELINCVEKELATTSSDFRHNNEAKSHRFLDDTFIENIMKAREVYQQEDNKYEEQESFQSLVEYNDTEDEYFYQQQQELAQLYKHNNTLKNGNIINSNIESDRISPKHILFNDDNTVYLIQKEVPVNKTLANCDKNRRHSESVLKARLKLKELSNGKASSNHDAKSMVLNNNRAIVKIRHQTPPTSAKRSQLQKQITNLEQYTSVKAHCGSNILSKRSPSVGRYQPATSRLSPNYQRRRSLADGVAYERNSYPLYDNGNSSTSSMGSGASSNGGILSDHSKSEKPRKKLSFREPVVAEKRQSRSQTAEIEGMNQNGLKSQKANNNSVDSNCDNLVTSRHTTATNESVPTEEDLKQSQAMRIVRTVGQAFEVCHKFNIHKNSLDNNDERSDISSSELLDIETRSDQQIIEDDGPNRKAHTPELNLPKRPNHLELVSQTNLNKSGRSFMNEEEKSPTTPLSPSHEIHKLKDQLEQQAMQTRQALAQLMLVREQLISETNARIEAQARTQQLLQQNRELLEHLASLGAYNEQQVPGLTSANIGIGPQLSSTAKVARWFQQLPWHTASLSRPESGFVSGDSRSEKFNDETLCCSIKDTDYLCDEFLLVEGSSTIWTKLSAKKRRKLLGMRLGKVTTF